jgi:hypothetical protein
LECLISQLNQQNDNHRLRLAYTGKIYGLVVGWLVCVLLCVACSGFSYKGFRLSDSVLLAFITSTTVTVVGLFVLVAKWMYPTADRPPTAEGLEKRATEIVKRKDRKA